MPIQIRIRILPQVKNILTFIHSGASLHCFIFLVRVIGDKICIFLTVHILKFSGKNIFALHLVEMEMNPDPDPDPAKRPTGSGSTTPATNEQTSFSFVYFPCCHHHRPKQGYFWVTFPTVMHKKAGQVGPAPIPDPWYGNTHSLPLACSFKIT